MRKIIPSVTLGILLIAVFTLFRGYADTIAPKKVFSALKTNDTSAIKPHSHSNPKSEEKSDSFDLNNILSAVLGGLIGLSPVIINYFKKSNVSGRVISEYANNAIPPNGTVLSTIVIQKISIFISNKDFFLKDFKVFLKLPNGTETECKNWFWRNLNFEIEVNGAQVRRDLNINKKEYLLHFTKFPKDEAVVGYASFATNAVINAPYEYVKYVFFDFSGNAKEVKFYSKDMNSNTQLFDDSIWV